MPFTREKQLRICRAVLQNLEVWIETVSQAEQAAIPGNKARLLGLQRNMEQARAALGRILADDAEAHTPVRRYEEVS